MPHCVIINSKHLKGMFNKWCIYRKFALSSSSQFCTSPRRHAHTHTGRMKTWQIYQYGDIGELTQNKSARISTIESPNEILVKVHAASVNPIDVRMMGGYGNALINVMRKRKGIIKVGSEFPITLGRDFSGTVVEVGKSVNRFKMGDEVWGAIRAERQGTHAEYTICSQDEISLKPSNISHIEAASMPYVATTSWSSLCTFGQLREKDTPGKRILILGGSGGIGTFSIQGHCMLDRSKGTRLTNVGKDLVRGLKVAAPPLIKTTVDLSETSCFNAQQIGKILKAWGADVTVTCSGDALDLVTQLGADTAVDYSYDVWQALGSLPKFDFILDTVREHPCERALPLLKPWNNSVLVTLTPPLLANSDSYGVLPGVLRSVVNAGLHTVKGASSGSSIRWGVFRPNGNALYKVAQMVEKGKIVPVLQESFPFSKIPDAFQTVSDGHLRGKIIIDMMENK